MKSNVQQKMFLSLLGVALLSFLVTACGVKNPPRPLGIPNPPAVSDLSHAISGETVILNWQTPAGNSRVMRLARGFWVYRSKVALTDGRCDGCPVLFKRVGDVPLDPAGPAGALQFSEPVEKGYHYVFKVAIYLENGTIGPDSNFVTFDH